MIRYVIVLLLSYINNSIAEIKQISNAIEPVQYFAGRRSELDDIAHKLNIYHKVSIIGMSGMGKTQIMRTYADLHKDQYDLIWFFDCNNDLNIQFIALAKQINNNLSLKESSKLDDSFTKAKQEVLAYLEPKKRWLLVFDNLRINQNSFITDLVNWEHNGNIVFNSQDAKDLLEIINLKQLDDSEAKNLVTTLLENQTDNHNQDIISLAKGYPLLLAQSSIFYKNNKHIPINEHRHFLNKFNDQTKLYVDNAINQLPNSAKELSYKVAMISNRFSKQFLKDITNNSENFEEDLYNLIRLGLVINIKIDDQEILFEMHDVIKKQISEKLTQEQKQNVLNNILYNVNKLIPDDVDKAYLLIKSDNVLFNNLELLFDQIELYESNLHNIFKLRKNLLTIYAHELNYNFRYQEISQWLLNKKDKLSNKLLISDEYKIAYSECLIIITIAYENVLDYANAIRIAKEADNIINQTKGCIKHKLEIKLRIAYLYLLMANIDHVREILAWIENNIDKSNLKDNDLRYLYFIKARIFLIEAKFCDSLNAVNKVIEIDHQNLDIINKNVKVNKYIPQDIYSAHAYIIKARILNYMNCYEDAQKLAIDVYSQNNKFNKIIIVQGNSLIELARAELGLGNVKMAHGHIQEAKETLLINNINNDLTLAQNGKLAYALVVEGECLYALGKAQEAVNNYAIAEAIYYNKYRANMKHINEVSYLYLAACQASCHLPDKFWFKKFKNQHLNKFGPEHVRSIEIQNMNCLN